MLRSGDLGANIVDFCALLRRDFGFLVGHAEAHDALRAVETVGISDVARVRSALRLTLCSKPDEIKILDEVFDAFFLHPERGAKQASYAPRHTRQQPGTSPTETARATCNVPAGEADKEDASHSGARPPTGDLVAALEQQTAASTETVEGLRAQYSPQAGSIEPPVIAAETVREHLPAADALVNSVRLGHLRRWKPKRGGARFDMRRTLRSSLHTGGDLVALRFLGHALRNPRFAVLIDGSRSMSSYGPLMLEFASALVQRSPRASVFVFSTALRSVTSALRRSIRQRHHQLADLGDSWGGGTKIGASLRDFVHTYGSRLNDETVVIIYSDGLDVGDMAQLDRAMHEIHSRSAAVVWVNPLAGTSGYAPTAQGMRAALRHVDAFIGLASAAELAALARHAGAATR